MAQVAFEIMGINARRLPRQSGTGGSAFQAAHQNRWFRKRQRGRPAMPIVSGIALFSQVNFPYGSAGICARGCSLFPAL
jgi:hypothetical protein